MSRYIFILIPNVVKERNLMEEIKINEKKEIIKKLKNFFITNSKFKEDRKNLFICSRKFINKKNNKQIYIKPFSIQTKFYKDYVFYKLFCSHLKQLAINKRLEPYFLTLTKEFNLEGKNIYESIDYTKEISQIYRQALREIIREFQRKHDILFISVIEFNHNLFFHLHAIIFINPLLENNFLNILENKIELFDLGYNKDFKKIDKDDENENFKRSCEYLLKTIKRAFKNIEYAYLLDGAVNILKYKLITHSKTKINKKMYFKLLPFVANDKKFKDSKYTKKDKKFLDIYKYLLKNTTIKNYDNSLSKSKLKKLLKTYKKHKILILQEKKEIEKSDEFVELQNRLLMKKILSCNKKEELLKNIDSYIDSYIESLKQIFSNNMLKNFRWKFNKLKSFLINGDVKRFKSSLESTLLYRSIKYIYTLKTIIYLRNKKKKWEKVYDSSNYYWKIKRN